MPFLPYNRDIYLGEPIDSLTVDQGDQFNLGLNLYDDEGNVWENGWDVDLYMYMSERDVFSGSGTELAHFSGSGSISSGSITVFVDDTGTTYAGNYKIEVIVSSGSGASDPGVAMGAFDFIVTRD